MEVAALSKHGPHSVLNLRKPRRLRAKASALQSSSQSVAAGRSNEEVVEWLAQRALSAATALGTTKGPGQRCVIGLAGCPGGGKSTVSVDVVAAINKAASRELAVVLPMDGYHYWRHELDRMPDPAEAHRRRGAPWTFDGAAFVEAVRRARGGESLSVPLFDHAHGDPIPDAVKIGDAVRVVLVEGNYLLLPDQPWAALHSGAGGGILHESWFMDVSVEEAMGRIVKRHMQANGDSRERAEARVAVNDKLNAEQVWLTRGRASVLVPSFPLSS